MASAKSSILCNARMLFAQQGFRGTTVAQIASASGVTDAAMYRHYSSKEALFQALVDDFMAQYRELLARIHERQKHGYCLLQDLITDHCAFTLAHSLDMQLMHTTCGTMPHARDAVAAFAEELKATVMLCLEKGRRDGSVRESVDEGTASIITILVLGLDRQPVVAKRRDFLVRSAVAFCRESIRSRCDVEE